MRKILFVCHGNICRSAMAEQIMKDLVRKAGQDNDFYIDSAAVSREEIGNPMDDRAAYTLKKHNIPRGDHRARRITRNDLKVFGEIYLMDEENRQYLSRLYPNADLSHVHMLDQDQDIEDPWWTGRFEHVYGQILKSCKRLLKEEN